MRPRARKEEEEEASTGGQNRANSERATKSWQGTPRDDEVEGMFRKRELTARSSCGNFCVSAGVVSYTIPDASMTELSDVSYDGKRQDNLLTDGLGCLTDGEVGADDYRVDMRDRKGKITGWTRVLSGLRKLPLWQFFTFRKRTTVPTSPSVDKHFTRP